MENLDDVFNKLGSGIFRNIKSEVVVIVSKLAQLVNAEGSDVSLCITNNNGKVVYQRASNDVGIVIW